MKTNYKSWIPGIVFWVLFSVSLAIGKRYRWVDTVWTAVWLIFLGVVAVYAAVSFFRNRGEFGDYANYRGVPRWVGPFFGAEVEER